jgi:uncharacterized protein (TIRG00374 family)
LKNRLLTLLKVAISLGLVVYAVTRPEIRYANWSEILAQVRPAVWLVGLALYFVAIGVNVLKWQYLLQTLGVRVPYPQVFRHNLVGLFFANLPLNMIGADIARGWDLARQIEPEQAGMDTGACVAVSVLVDRLVGLGAFLFASVAGLVCAVLVLGRTDLGWLLGTVGVVLAAYGLAFAMLMSGRLRRLVEKLFRGPLSRFLALYRRRSDAVQVYRTHAGALAVAFGLGLVTVFMPCVVNYWAAVTVGAPVPLVWALILTPLTSFLPFIPSIASGLGVNQGAFVILYHNLTGLVGQAPAFAMSLAMQLIILVASLPGAVLWWRKRR